MGDTPLLASRKLTAVAAPGRSQREPMERLVRLMSALSAAGQAGVSGTRLVEIAGFDGEDATSQLNREFRHLRNQGWMIENVAAPGADGRYVLTRGDNLLRLRLTREQQTQLQRAALLASRADLGRRLGLAEQDRPRDVVLHDSGDAEALATVVAAVRDRALLRFRYKGSERAVRPGTLRHEGGQWYLSGVEVSTGSATVKHFVVARMSEVTADRKGSAGDVQADREARLHPVLWAVDEPVEVVLRCRTDYLPDVRRALSDPVVQTGAGDGVVELTYRVTNREALRSRLYALGERVDLVAPDEVRDEMLAELAEMAGESQEESW